MRKQRPPNVTAEALVRAWSKAKSLADVCRDTGLTKDAASVRASVLRKRGVRLRRFNEATGRPPLDVEALNRLAKDNARA